MADAADLPNDDLSIADATWALRRVHPDQARAGRPDTSVFKAGKDGIGTSVTLSTGAADLAILKAGYEPHGVVAIQVGEFRARGLKIAYTFEDGNPNHCEVFGPRGKSIQRELSQIARWVVRPSGLGEDQIPSLFDPQAAP